MAGRRRSSNVGLNEEPWFNALALQYSTFTAARLPTAGRAVSRPLGPNPCDCTSKNYIQRVP